MSPILKFALQSAKARHYHILALLLFVTVVGGAIALPTSFLSGTNVLIGVCLFPFALFFSPSPRFNYTYLLLLVFFGTLAYVYHVRTFYFFMLAFYVLLLLEAFVGRINPLILFLLLFMSPFFHQISVILGFPIRLELSLWAGQMLAMTGMDITVDGNMMVLNGALFTVDEACMGLSMLAISLLMGVAAIVHHYRRSGLRLNFLWLSMFFVAVAVFNLISNLFRIMLLVMFQILPDNPMHDGVGIGCLILYVMVPLYFLSNRIIRKFGKPPLETESIITVPNVMQRSIAMSLCVFVLVTAFHIREKRSGESAIAHANVHLPNAQAIKMNDGITKLYNDQLLVYVKPIPEFFTGEHTPLLCWKGSGYEFKGVRKMRIDEKEIYVGKLENNGHVLFTAWWYSNGKTITIDQWDWRKRMLMGEARFCLINVTAGSNAALLGDVESIFKNGWLAIQK